MGANSSFFAFGVPSENCSIKHRVNYNVHKCLRHTTAYYLVAMKESCVHGCVMTSVASPFIRENGDVFQHFLLYSSIESLFYCCDEFLYTFADKVVELT